MRWRNAWGVAIRFVERRIVWVSFLAATIYWLAASVLPTQPWLETARIVQATTATAAFVALSSGIWDAISREHPDRADALLIGTSLTQVSFAVSGLWLLLFRLAYAGEPGGINWMLNTHWFGFMTAWLPAMSSLLLMTVPGVVRRDESGEEIPATRLIGVGCVSGAGLFCVLVVLATQPNARWLVETIKPWLY